MWGSYICDMYDTCMQNICSLMGPHKPNPVVQFRAASHHLINIRLKCRIMNTSAYVYV